MPIILVTMIETREIMPQDSRKIHFGKLAKVVISEPVEMGRAGRKERLAATDKMRKQIAQNLETLARSEKILFRE